MSKRYSGKQVIRAGEMFLDDKIFDAEKDDQFQHAMEVLSYWRFSHEEPLNKAHLLVRSATNGVDKSAILAKRLKRHVSIVGKLRRFKSENMKLKNMQDIGGCRAILKNEKKLRQALRDLKRKSQFKNSNGEVKIKDYISTPKIDGYRGVHIIGKFPDSDGTLKNIEVQLRTRIQHYWATAVEIIDLFTGQALKSNQGEIKWESFFMCISEQFSLMEGIHGFERMSPAQQYAEYRGKLALSPSAQESCRTTKQFAEKLHVITKLKAFSSSIKVLDEKISNLKVDGYALIQIDIKKLTISTRIFNASDSAESEFIEAEKSAAKDEHIVVALVSTTALGGIKEAYPNYFADSSQFMMLMSLVMKVDFNNSFWSKVLGRLVSS